MRRPGGARCSASGRVWGRPCSQGEGGGGIQIVNLTDAAGAGQAPTGGVSTGFGGTVSHGGASPLLWLILIGGGALLMLTGGWALRRNGQRRLASD